MYKILIADDEPIAVESLKFMINRNFSNSVIIEGCDSGKTAIESARRFFPDIAIMDIDMPGINGLEAIKEIKKFHDEVEFIIISAFDYFDFAQEAVSLGVSEYLVKPVKEEKLTQTLQNLFERTSNRSKEKQKYLEQQERLSMSVPLMEESFFSMLSSIEEHTDKMEETLELLGFENRGGYVVMLDIMDENLHGLILDAYKYKLKRLCDCIAHSKKNRITAYILDESVGSLYKSNAQSIIDKIAYLAKDDDLNILIGIGRKYDVVAKAKQSYIEAGEALKYLKNGGKAAEQTLMFHDDLPDSRPGLKKNEQKQLEDNIYTYMEAGDVEMVFEELVRHIENESAGNAEFDDVKKSILEVIIGLGRHFKVPPEDTWVLIENAMGVAGKEELKQIVSDIILHLYGVLEMRKPKKADGAIDMAELYIIEHYAEPINLEEISNLVNLSQHYLSRMFKQEKKIGFSDYVAMVRIEQAKKLLMVDGLAVKEVALMVGFQDPNYFSKSFKKITGKTPGEYKSHKIKE